MNYEERQSDIEQHDVRAISLEAGQASLAGLGFLGFATEGNAADWGPAKRLTTTGMRVSTLPNSI